MAKISEMSLTELYERKITSSVEREILLKEGFLTKSDRWCEKVCKLACKNPPNPIFFTEQVDVLVIQDFSAFDEPRFRKRGADIERKHREIISHIAQKTLGEALEAVIDGGEPVKCVSASLAKLGHKVPTLAPHEGGRVLGVLRKV